MYASTFVSICNHCLDPMHVCTKTPQLHLLALTSFDCKGIRVHPLARRHVCRLRGIGEDVEHSRFVHDWQKGNRRDDLFENVPDLLLDLCLWLGWTTSRFITARGLNQRNIKDPSLQCLSRLLSNDSQHQLSNRSGGDPFWSTGQLRVSERESTEDYFRPVPVS